MFLKLRPGNLNLEDNSWSGLPVVTNVEEFKTLIESNPRLTCQEYGELINKAYSTVVHYLINMWKISCEGVSSPLWATKWKWNHYSSYLFSTDGSLEAKSIHKRPALFNQQNNARLCTTAVMITKINSVVWKILQHSPYSPDLATSNYHLIRQNHSLQAVKKPYTSIHKFKTRKLFSKGNKTLALEVITVLCHASNYIFI